MVYFCFTDGEIGGVSFFFVSQSILQRKAFHLFIKRARRIDFFDEKGCLGFGKFHGGIVAWGFRRGIGGAPGGCRLPLLPAG